MHRHSLATAAVLVAVTAAPGQTPFVNFESAHVHPIDTTPDDEALVAVNTADNRVEVFRIDGPDVLTHLGSVPVGLEPVSVRARAVREVWVVNRVSDSVSIVNLSTMNVEATISTGDEPGDVVFAGDKAFISVGTPNELWVYDTPYMPGATPMIVSLDGEDPRSLATDGDTVYCCYFSAGSGTTALNHAFVTNPDVNPYAGDPNPPPNSGSFFSPPINPALLVDEDGDGVPDIRMPRSSMILKQDDDGAWVDDNGGDWSAESIANTGAPVPWWNLTHHVVARVDVDTLAVSHIERLMSTPTAAAVNPVTGDLAVVGIAALNHVRFEPNLKGRFASMNEAVVPIGGTTAVLKDLNPHIIDFFPPAQSVEGVGGLPQVFELAVDQRQQSLGDPRGVAWAGDGSYKLITGRGSNSLLKTSASGQRLAHIGVGQGPTGVRVHGTLPRAYVLNQFDGTVSIIDLGSFSESGTVSFFDPTPDEIRIGRPHLYDTHKSSGFGHLSCQTCHLDGSNDLLAWDLGDPSGDMKAFNQTCIGGSQVCDNEDWHPMKGPMTTQTLFGLHGTEPFHWRGDREDFAAFNPAFESLMDAPQLTDEEMAEFTAFIETLRYPPNPNRLRTGDLAPLLSNGGDPVRGKFLFETPPDPGGGGGPDGEPAPIPIDMGHLMPVPSGGGMPAQGGVAGAGAGGFNCAGCHALPTGSNFQILRTFISDAVTGIHHLTKTAQLRDQYRKDGFDVFAAGEITRGFGLLHDGSFDTHDSFLTLFFGMDAQDKLDVEAFLLSLGTDTHAGVGSQVTIGGTDVSDVALRDELIAIADTGDVGLIVKGRAGSVPRGWTYLGGGLFQSDRLAEITSTAELDALAAPAREQTYTLVELGTETRMGVDRDSDGFLDRDEIDQCSDPADPEITPIDPDGVPADCCADICAVEPSCCEIGWSESCAALRNEICPFCHGDVNFDGKVDIDDIVVVVLNFGLCDSEPCPGDANFDGKVDIDDIVVVVLNFGECPMPAGVDG